MRTNSHNAVICEGTTLSKRCIFADVRFHEPNASLRFRLNIEYPVLLDPFCNMYPGIVSVDNPLSLTFSLMKSLYFGEDIVDMVLARPLLPLGQNTN
jgi:hypothetical protein